MRFVSRTLCLGLIALTLLVLSETTASALSCGLPPSEDSRDTADVVALGEVERVRNGVGTSLAEVDVERVFKGGSGGTLYVRTRGSQWGVHFGSGERYLIYAERSGGQLRTEACNGTQVIAGARGERTLEEARLGVGRKPGGGSTPEAGALRFWATSPAGVSAMLVPVAAAGFGVFYGRRRRP